MKKCFLVFFNHPYICSVFSTIAFLLLLLLRWRITPSVNLWEHCSGLIALFIMLFNSLLIIPTGVIEGFLMWGLSFCFQKDPFTATCKLLSWKELSSQSLLFCLLCWNCFSLSVLFFWFLFFSFFLFFSYSITESHLSF